MYNSKFELEVIN